MNSGKIRTFLFSLFLFLLLGGSASYAAPTYIAVLISSRSTPYAETFTALQQYLEKNKYDVIYDLYQFDSDNDTPGQLFDSIDKKKHELVVSLGSLALKEAAKNWPDIPIVAAMVYSKETIEKFQNVTGVVLEIPLEVQFAWLKKFCPEAKNIGVLYNPQQNKNFIEQAELKAKMQGLQLQAEAVSSPQDLPAAMENLTNTADVLWAINDPMVLNAKTAKNILLFSFRNRIPFVGLSSSWVQAGALYALDRNYQDIGSQCGEIVHKIMQGTAVDSLPPVSPRTINYSLNLKTEKQMKMKFEQSLIDGAEKVF